MSSEYDVAFAKAEKWCKIDKKVYDYTAWVLIPLMYIGKAFAWVIEKAVSFLTEHDSILAGGLCTLMWTVAAFSFYAALFPVADFTGEIVLRSAIFIFGVAFVVVGIAGFVDVKCELSKNRAEKLKEKN